MAYKEEDIERIFKDITDKISIDGLPLRKILMEEGMPSSQTFYNWLESDETKSKQYARACEDRADSIFEEILDISDESNADVIVIQGKAVIDGSAIQRSRLKVDARKWMLSKMNPKKYGDKVDVTSDGEKLETKIINIGTGINPDETTS